MSRLKEEDEVGPGSTFEATMRVPAMSRLCDEVLAEILKKLPVRDAVRARTVCRRWRVRVEEEEARFGFLTGARSYCPLVFKRVDAHHSWEGYDGEEWRALPSLSNVPRVIELLPIAGSGHGLLAFKITSEFSGYIVGNPYQQKWTTLPRTAADCWGDAAMVLVRGGGEERFRVVAVRDEDTHIYRSETDEWERVGRSPECVRQGQAVKRIRTKAGAAVCDETLYVASADGKALISFDVRTERWREERLDVPVLLLLECAGSLFVVTEDDARGVEVWTREFSLAAQMPPEIHRLLMPRGQLKLRAVGHGHRLFFWRQKSLCVVAYDLFTRRWLQLPNVAGHETTDAADPDAPQRTCWSVCCTYCMENCLQLHLSSVLWHCFLQFSSEPAGTEAFFEMAETPRWPRVVTKMGGSRQTWRGTSNICSSQMVSFPTPSEKTFMMGDVPAQRCPRWPRRPHPSWCWFPLTVRRLSWQAS